MKLKGKGVDAALLDLANDRSIILNEFYSYLESGEIARVYDYMADGYQYNFRHLKRKVIKEDTKTVINWLNKTDDIDIIAKNLVLFVDGRRSCVPFHHMYMTPLHSTIYNEDCVFKENIFNYTMKKYRTEHSYSNAFIIIKPNKQIIIPNAWCQPYIASFYLNLNTNKVIITNDAGSYDIANDPVCVYYRSNIKITNASDDNAIIFTANKWIFNNLNYENTF